jgi:hypothetical protein
MATYVGITLMALATLSGLARLKQENAMSKRKQLKAGNTVWLITYYAHTGETLVEPHFIYRRIGKIFLVRKPHPLVMNNMPMTLDWLEDGFPSRRKAISHIKLTGDEVPTRFSRVDKGRTVLRMQ